MNCEISEALKRLAGEYEHATTQKERDRLTREIARACPRVSDVELFDIYRGEQIGEGKKSMAFKIRFEPDDKALTPDDIERFVKKILGNLKFKLGAEIR